MPGMVSRCWACSAGRDLSADLAFCLPMRDRYLFVASVSEPFLIEIDTVLPAWLSCLLGVPHLFVHFGMAYCLTWCSFLASLVLFSIYPTRIFDLSAEGFPQSQFLHVIVCLVPLLKGTAISLLWPVWVCIMPFRPRLRVGLTLASSRRYT